jgi:hypothetical protein
MGERRVKQENRAEGRSVWVLLVVLGGALAWLFRDSFSPDLALFANDGPLGLVSSRVFRMPEGLLRIWMDLNWLGFDGTGMPPTWHALWFWILGGWGFINFSPLLACLALGMSVWLFCRASGMAGPVAVLAGVAGGLNGDFFSYASWGLPTLTTCVASVFLAMAALRWPGRPWWLRVGLAGAALGHALMEGFDNGAIFSLYVAAFAVALVWWETPGSAGKRLGWGMATVAGVAVASGLVAAHVLLGLIQTQIQGVSGMGQDQESKAARWSFATQGSLPPKETLRAVIPGLFGYRMDTPEGGVYWGRVGSDPAWDAYWSARERRPEQRPAAMPRHSGAGHFAGVLVVLVAAFGVVQSWGRGRGVLTLGECRWVWFWTGSAVVSILLAYGRHAPFYQLFYALPYFSTIRMPVKFLHPFNVSVVVLFAYGLQALWRGWVMPERRWADGLGEHWKVWWGKATAGERRWTGVTVALVGASMLAWLIYGTARSGMMAHLAEAGFGEADARAIARFSQREVMWFWMFLGMSVGLVLLLLSGWWSGARARWAGVGVGALMLLDFGRANTAWIQHYEWRERLATNPVFDVLRAQPQEGRVVGQLPFALPGAAGQALRALGDVYALEWIQHAFRYHDIQALEVVQLPRAPIDYMEFKTALQGNPVREWELTNTRYVFALAPLLEAMNQQLDGGRGRFRLHTAFELSQGPSGNIVVRTNAEGPYALLEFSGALPRVMLYDRWRSGVEDEEALGLLASPQFDPMREVLVAESAPQPSVETSSQPAGTVRYLNYQPTRWTVETEARTPCVLLVNDRHHQDWKVTVDGEEEPLLRVNYVMRGVYLTPGRHTVEFRFDPPTRTLWLTLGMLGMAVGLVVVGVRWRKSEVGMETKEGAGS